MTEPDEAASVRLVRWAAAALYMNAMRNLLRTPTPRPDRLTICGHPAPRQPFTHLAIVGQHITPALPPRPLVSPVGYLRRLRWIARVMVTPPWRRTPAPPGHTTIAHCSITDSAAWPGITLRPAAGVSDD